MLKKKRFIRKEQFESALSVDLLEFLKAEAMNLRNAEMSII